MDGAGEGGGAAALQRIQSSAPKQPNRLDVPIFCSSQFGGQIRPIPLNHSPEGMKRPGIPPSHPNNHNPPSPYSQIATPRSGSQNLSPGPSHSRSLSQPSVFSLDCLPPLTPLPHREASDVSMEERACNSHMSSLPSPGASLPPRRGHRRSNSDVPLGFSAMIQSSPQLIPIGSKGVLGGETSGVVKCESEWDKKGDGEIVDDLFNAYMNLDSLNALNSSGTEDKELDSRASGTKTNGGESSDNEVESRVKGHTQGIQGSSSSFAVERREGVKRSAGGDIAPTSRHYRSVSMDSFMGNLHFDDESSKLPPLAARAGQHSPSNSMDGISTKFNFDLASGEFSGAELKKIMENDKLAEIAISDPRRAKRILANRQSAARSKERKMRYIAELEHKVQTLQTEATTLSAQVTMLQRDSTGLTSENNELKFRLQSMEQQAQLKDALNEALTAEVRRLKIAAAEYGGESHLSNCMAQQLSINQHMYQMQNQQHNQLNIYQLQQHQQQQPPHDQPLVQQRNVEVAMHESSQ